MAMRAICLFLILAASECLDVTRALNPLDSVLKPSNSSLTPPPLLINMSLVEYTKSRIQHADPDFLPAYYSALSAADKELSAGPWTVMDCPHMPPSGDRHDYMSVSKYFWPCNNNPCNASVAHCSPAGLPWLDCDGITNTAAVDQYDLPRITALGSAIESLSAAYLWSGNVSYAERVIFLWRYWFLDNSTRMNPNGNFMQAVPGLNNGSSWGIIEMSVFLPPMLDGISVVAQSGLWTPADQAGTVLWLQAWLQWLHESALGQAEGTANNNHQTYYDQMVLSAAIWTGNLTLAADTLRGTLEPPPQGNKNAPLGVQIWSDGQLPVEEARTNSVGYVAMDLLGLLRLGMFSRYAPVAALGVPDLLHYVTHANSSSIRGAMDFMIPYVRGVKHWPFLNIDNATFATAGYFELYRRAAHAGWDAPYYADVALSMQEENLHSAALLYWPWPLVGAISATGSPDKPERPE